MHLKESLMSIFLFVCLCFQVRDFLPSEKKNSDTSNYYNFVDFKSLGTTFLLRVTLHTLKHPFRSEHCK